jgi:hypothetical protein
VTDPDAEKEPKTDEPEPRTGESDPKTGEPDPKEHNPDADKKTRLSRNSHLSKGHNSHLSKEHNSPPLSSNGNRKHKTQHSLH